MKLTSSTLWKKSEENKAASSVEQALVSAPGQPMKILKKEDILSHTFLHSPAGGAVTVSEYCCRARL